MVVAFLFLNKAFLKFEFEKKELKKITYRFRVCCCLKVWMEKVYEKLNMYVTLETSLKFLKHNFNTCKKRFTCMLCFNLFILQWFFGVFIIRIQNNIDPVKAITKFFSFHIFPFFFN